MDIEHEEPRDVTLTSVNNCYNNYDSWNNSKQHIRSSVQARWSSDLEYYVSNKKFKKSNGLKRKKHIANGVKFFSYLSPKDNSRTEPFTIEKLGRDNKRRKPPSLPDEVRDMVPSTYSSTDVRDQDDSPSEMFDDNQKEMQMKQKLAHRLIVRFENDSNDMEPSKTPSQQRKVDSSDLASAMALASLAYHSPSYSGDDSKKKDQFTKWPRLELPCFNSQNVKNCRPSDEYYYSDQHPCHGDDKWICDYCHAAAFDTFQEACDHEKVCAMRHAVMPSNCIPTSDPPSGTGTASSISMVRDEAIAEQRNNEAETRADTETDLQGKNIALTDIKSSDRRHYFSGSVPLSIPTTDSEWLSELNCYVRDKCVEAFSAKEDDVVKTSKRGRISLHQVGIRCKFCASENLKDRAVAAVSYPVSISGVYESVKRWQRVHLAACACIPADVRNEIKSLSESSVWVPTTRQYWSDSAKALGIIDTCDGLRFTHDPARHSNVEEAATRIMNSRFGSSRLKKELEAKKSEKNQTNGTDVKYIVFPGDQALVPPYVYFLMRQVQLCHFTEADRFVARSKSKIGFAGFECRHCLGHAGLGKYFPSSPKGLSTNSTSQNIYSHIMKCRRCPKEIQEKLNNLKKEKYTWPRRTCGWRQAFFDQVWKRLHGP